MTGNIRILTLLISLGLTALTCSPTPMLQSPRVKSNFSIGATGSYEYQVKNLKLEIPVTRGTSLEGVPIIDTVRRNYDNEREYLPVFNPWYLKWGIARRVEIGALMIPYLWYGYIINGHLKIFLNEHGKHYLFRNVSYALFGGGSAIHGEWNKDKTAYAGVILATRQSSQHREIELILQPSYFQQRLINYGGPREYGFIDGFQVNFGTIYTAFKSERFALELIAGGAYRRELSNNWRLTDWTFDGETEIFKGNNIRSYSPLVFQGGLVFNFSSGRR